MRRIILAISLILLFSGTGILIYPHIKQQQYRQYAKDMIVSFENRLETYISDSEEESLRWIYLLMVDYNKMLYETGQENFVDPFSYSQVDFSLMQFGFEEEMIGYITIPKMNIELPIFLGANDKNLNRGAAHLTQTSLSVGGINTNSVIAAHRGMSTAAMFRDIELLELGDEIIITNFYQTIRYEVVETKIILPTQVDAVLIQSSRDLVTLITCHPLRHNSQRYLVYAERVKE